VKLVILITARTERTLDIAQAWQNAGAPGATILEGHGLRRLTEKIGFRDDVPLMPSFASLLRQQEITTHVLISAVTDTLADELYKVTVDILGDLTQPDNGFIFTVDIEKWLGLLTGNTEA
jgi:hypothetical protein